MHDDPKRDVDDSQARYAERLDIEPDPADPAVRHVVLEGTRVGKIVHNPSEFAWELFYLHDGEYEDALCAVMGEPDDTEEADRLGVGFIADAIARGDYGGLD